MLKYCTGCQEFKLATSEYFHKDRTKKDGLGTRCKVCTREYRQANKEAIADRDRRYLEENPEKRAETVRRYYEANREKEAEKNRRWREANPGWAAAYNKANPEKTAEAQRRYQEANREKLRERNRQSREAHPEKVAESQRRYREAHRERIAERLRRRREENPGREAEYQRRYREANPDKAKQRDNLRRVRKAMAPGFHTEEEWQALCSYYMDQCLRCGEVPDALTRDHVVPLSKGGTDDISNIQPLCRSCNCSKGVKTVDYRL